MSNCNTVECICSINKRRFQCKSEDLYFSDYKNFDFNLIEGRMFITPMENNLKLKISSVKNDNQILKTNRFSFICSLLFSSGYFVCC